MTNLSTTEVEAIGYVGGVVLALCLAPQIVQVVRTESAEDISYAWQFLYLVGLAITLAYLVLVDAVAGYVSVIVEIALLLVLVACKWYYDRKRVKRALQAELVGDALTGIRESENGADSDAKTPLAFV
ncbi:hypothetical protein AMAG_13112 [Allomyces macrogynus ATCC 38327]|uniref:Uncharacterized protein n=1 Tax=Allomyces macrogynus (strain ATCC 38327) TaxID=578462 RepID=A0A0L0SZS8_ALLM3|nr:hypothetical protein AMAG_13112 [Allomyces macrogynus ATCC 38327]|eukprot:KNE67925.1 hypothetical protein AMAG_13112 [Allomyces macrogynus ATCC 38327]